MTEVRSPNHPGKGDVSVKVVACLQSTSPVRIGIKKDKNGKKAEATAIGIASRVTNFTPQRFTNVKNKPIAVATAATGRLGKYHCWMAAEDRSAVNPQVGTQPHQ